MAYKREFLKELKIAAVPAVVSASILQIVDLTAQAHINPLWGLVAGGLTYIGRNVVFPYTHVVREGLNDRPDTDIERYYRRGDPAYRRDIAKHFQPGGWKSYGNI